MGINYDLIAHIGTIGTYLDQNGERWNTEVNVISWNGRKPEFDIRTWDAGHNKMHYGVKLNHDELKNLVAGMNEYYKGVAE